MSVEEELKKLEQNIKKGGSKKKKEQGNKPLKKGGKMDDRDSKGRFIGGYEGGPGRPKGSVSITDAVKRKLQEAIEVKDGKGNKVKRTYLEMVILKIMDKAIKEKDFQTLKTIWNYIDGMPKQRLEHGGEDGEPIQMDIRISKLLEKAYDRNKNEHTGK